MSPTSSARSWALTVQPETEQAPVETRVPLSAKHGARYNPNALGPFSTGLQSVPRPESPILQILPFIGWEMSGKCQVLS